jgi:bifunctional DNA-binding transcriptional regulator/antitoxin component of YhaV-PrlF toxin-antitoxin module
MSPAPERLEALTRGLPTKSAKIRTLADAGVPRADIARFLGIRYQHVRNVLVDRESKQAVKGAGPDSPADTGATSTARVRLGPNGRILLPPSMQEALAVKEGEVLLASVENGEVRLLTVPAAIRRAQALVRKFVPEGARLADELLDDRRQEVRDERKNG